MGWLVWRVVKAVGGQVDDWISLVGWWVAWWGG